MKKLWFKNKTYGWGWTPASKEGWWVTFIFLILYTISAISFASIIEQSAHVAVGYLALYIGWMLAVTFVFITICFKMGEKPRWKWGKKS